MQGRTGRCVRRFLNVQKPMTEQKFSYRKMPRNVERRKPGVFGGCTFIWYLELSEQRTHLSVRPYILHRGKCLHAVNGKQGYGATNG